MKRHLLVISALMASAASPVLAQPLPVGCQIVCPPGVGAAGAMAGGRVVGGGAQVIVNGRAVYDDRGGAAGAGFAPVAAGVYAPSPSPIMAAPSVYAPAPPASSGIVSSGIVSSGVVSSGSIAPGVVIDSAPAYAPAPIITQTVTQEPAILTAPALVARPAAAPAVVAAGGGWGARVFIGASAGATLSSAWGAELRSKSGALKDKYDLKTKGGASFGLQAGVELEGGWRAKVEYMRLAGKIDLAASGAGPKGSTTKADANAGFVTVEKAFAVSEMIRPYVGVGVGYLKPESDVAGLEGKGSYAVKLAAGASAPLGRNLEAYGEYAYIMAPKTAFESSAGRLAFDYRTHVLSAGLKLNFN